MAHHGACLRAQLQADGLSASDADAVLSCVARGKSGALLTKPDLAIIAFARKLTQTPHEVSQADVAEMRQRGFSDRAIYDIVNIVALFAYIARLASGLGLPLEPDWETVYPRMVPRMTAPGPSGG